MISQNGVLTGSYDHTLVILSALIVTLASYAALDLGERVNAARGRTRLIWLCSGSLAMGIGIWSMHYTAMVAFRLPVPVLYHWPTALLSLGTGVLGSAVALFVISRSNMGWVAALTGSIFQGCAIAGMHYLGMDSMRLAATCHYSAAIVAVSVLVAIAGSFLSLRLTFLFRDGTGDRKMRRTASAVLMGAAICAMHFTGMAAATFRESSGFSTPDHTVPVTLLGALGIDTVAAIALGCTVATALVDRLRGRTALLEVLFEQMPQPVVLMDSKNKVVRVNQEFTQVFGYTPTEALGRGLADLIARGDLREGMERKLERVLRGERVDAEAVRQCKDGSRVNVLVVTVPVSFPGERIAMCSIYRDVTQRKAAENAVQRLSASLLETQENERRHLARELHDEIGQNLTGLRFLLRPNGDLSVDANRSRMERARALVDDLIERVRGLSFDLRPADLDQLGLLPALHALFERFTAQTGMLVDLRHHGVEGRFSSGVETCAYRIVQEALTNVARHAGVPGLTVRVWAYAGTLNVQVVDKGAGFDVDNTMKAPHSGAGLHGMRERVVAVGGRLVIESSPGSGTTVTAEIPLEYNGFVNSL